VISDVLLWRNQSHIHLTILISARWSATTFSFLTGQVSLPCNMLLHTQLLYNLPLIINDTSLLVSSGTNCLNLFRPMLGLLHQFYRVLDNIVQNSLLPFLRKFLALAEHLSRGSNSSLSNETWPVRKENEVALQRTEMRSWKMPPPVTQSLNTSHNVSSLI